MHDMQGLVAPFSCEQINPLFEALNLGASSVSLKPSMSHSLAAPASPSSQSMKLCITPKRMSVSINELFQTPNFRQSKTASPKLAAHRFFTPKKALLKHLLPSRSSTLMSAARHMHSHASAIASHTASPTASPTAFPQACPNQTPLSRALPSSPRSTAKLMKASNMPLLRAALELPISDSNSSIFSSNQPVLASQHDQLLSDLQTLNTSWESAQSASLPSVSSLSHRASFHSILSNSDRSISGKSSSASESFSSRSSISGPETSAEQLTAPKVEAPVQVASPPKEDCFVLCTPANMPGQLASQLQVSWLHNIWTYCIAAGASYQRQRMLLP